MAGLDSMLGTIDGPVIGHYADVWFEDVEGRLYAVLLAECRTSPEIVAEYIAYKMGVRE